MVEPRQPPPDPGRLAFIGLGANLGDREGSLGRAIEALGQAGLVAVLRSSVYRTAPVEVLDQGEFLNQVVGCPIDRPPEDLLRTCLAIERAMGRVRTRERGPRVIDLDLLLAGSEVRDRQDLVVPHPRLHLRRFVLVPLAEIAPGARHPVLGLSAAEMLARCPDRGRVERLL